MESKIPWELCKRLNLSYSPIVFVQNSSRKDDVPNSVILKMDDPIPVCSNQADAELKKIIRKPKSIHGTNQRNKRKLGDMKATLIPIIVWVLETNT